MTIANDNAAQIAALTTAEMVAVTTADMAVLTPLQLQAITAADIAVLSTAQVAAIGVSGLGVLTSIQVAAISTADIAALTSAQLAVIGSLSAPVTLTGSFAVDDKYFIYISTDDSVAGTLIGQGTRSYTYVSYLQNLALTPGVTNYLHIEDIQTGGGYGLSGTFTLSSSVASFSNGAQSLTSDETNWKASLNNLNYDYTAQPWVQAVGAVAFDGATGVGGLLHSIREIAPAISSGYNGGRFTVDFSTAITVTSVATLAWLTPAQAAAILIANIAALSTAQTATLTLAQMAALTSGQLAALPIADIAALSAAQLAAIRNGPAPVITLAATPSVNNASSATLGTAASGFGTDALSLTLISDSSFATGSSIALRGGQLVYTPGLITIAQAGPDMLDYTITDVITGTTIGETQIVMLNNGPAPLVRSSAAPTAIDGATATLATVAAGRGNDGLTVLLTTDAAFSTGSRLMLSDDSIIYSPGLITATNSGSDTISYTVSDTVTGATTLEVQVITLRYSAPDPVAGVSTADFSSVEMGMILSGDGTFAFAPGTEVIALTDGMLSIGPDTDASTIQRLYEGLLGRGNDIGGMRDYGEQLSAGISRADVAAQFVASPEYSEVHGTQSDEQFVAGLYQGLLGRTPEATGSANWMNLLSLGASRGSVAAGIADSDEAKGFLAAATARVWMPIAAATTVHELYETGLGRDAELTGLESFTALLATETSAQVAAAIAGSAEFAAIHSGQSNIAYVGSLYEAGLGRSADPAGSAIWTGALDSGAVSRSEVLLGIATSPEAGANLTRNLNTL